MLIKEEVNKTCKKCGHYIKQVSEAVYGCDNCKKPIDHYVKGKHYHDCLRLTIFRSPAGSSVTEDKEYCCWACAFEDLRKIKSDYFVNLPHLTYEPDVLPGQGIADLLACIRPNIKEQSHDKETATKARTRRREYHRGAGDRRRASEK